MEENKEPQQIAWRCECGKESDISGFVQSFVHVAVEKERREIGEWLNKLEITISAKRWQVFIDGLENLKQGKSPTKAQLRL